MTTSDCPDAQMLSRTLRTWARRYGHENLRLLTSAWSDSQGRMSDMERMMSNTFDIWNYEHHPETVRQLMETWLYYHPSTPNVAGVSLERKTAHRPPPLAAIEPDEVSEPIDWVSPPSPLIPVDDEDCGYSECVDCAEPLFWTRSRSGQVCLNGHFQLPPETEERITQFRKPKRERAETPSPLDIAMFDAEKKQVARNCEALAERLNISDLEEIVGNTPWYRPSNEWLPEEIYRLQDMYLSLAEQAESSETQKELEDVADTCMQIGELPITAGALMMIRHRSADIASQLSQQAQGQVLYYSDTSNPAHILCIERTVRLTREQAEEARKRTLALPPGGSTQDEVVTAVKILRPSPKVSVEDFDTWEEDEEDMDSYDEDEEVDDEPPTSNPHPRRTDSLLVDMLSAAIRLAQAKREPVR